MIRYVASATGRPSVQAGLLIEAIGFTCRAADGCARLPVDAAVDRSV